jgi:hypothetical protein
VGLFRTIIFFAALLHGSAAFASDDPTALDDLVRSGPIVRVSADRGGDYVAALLNGAVVRPLGDPCSLASDDEIVRVLGGAIVPVPVDQIGEETAPYCLWATAGRKAEIKLEIWSDAELPVLNMPDAESYFVKLEAEARSEPSFMPLDGFGARAFERDGSIVVLKTGRVIVVDFTGVRAEHLRWLVGRMVPRL